MSFGFGVGDFVAVLNLLQRVATELRNYQNAPASFQELRVELELLRSTILHVLRIEPANEAERDNLDRVRAIAMHCHRPLLAMIDKMQSKDSSLGHFRTTRSLSAAGIRLHWSLLKQKDIDDLRKVILSEMVAINMLLSVQQL
jgi:hypothetical protein